MAQLLLQRGIGRRMPRMKSIVSALSILALGFGLLGCSSGGSGGGVTFTITTTAAPFGVIGNAYTATLATTGGTAPLTWMLFGGLLPAGLSLNPGTGVVSGTPTAEGNSTAVFTVRDSTGKTATGSVLFAVHTRTDRVSVDSNGTAGNGASSAPSSSSDGSLVAFVSQSTNFVTGVNGSQVYVHNRQTNQIELVSRDNSASVVIVDGNGVSNAPTMNTDGRFVAFVSQATNLLAPGAPAVPAGQQIYVRDRQTGLTSLVSVDNNVTSNPGNGFSSAPSVSADGRFIAFVSQATNLLAPGTPAVPAGQQIYVRDRQTGLTSLVSVDNNVTSNPGNGFSSAPSVSADGRFVAFVSLATNLLAPGIPAVAGQQIYVRDRQVNQTSLASTDNNAAPNPGNGVSSAPSINGDGSVVAFDSLATNLLAPGVPSVTGRQVYVRNRTANQTSLVSADNNVVPNPGNGVSRTPSISSDGRFVAFTSLSTNLLAPGIPAVASQQVYSRDRQINQTNLVSQDNTSTDVAGNGVSDTPVTNSDGRFVAFFSQASNLVAGSAAFSDIYVRALP
ncbi:MAG: PD40 domain-containing protein [Nitrospirota bacterium]|nr:PD40 domain-containing protein [Nitrospirota bacterium]